MYFKEPTDRNICLVPRLTQGREMTAHMPLEHYRAELI